MSLKAIIYRAHFLKIITSQQYRAANVRLSKTGQTKVEKYDERIEMDKPEWLRSSIEPLNNELGITFSKIAENLNITPETLSTIAGFPVREYETESNVEPLFR